MEFWIFKISTQLATLADVIECNSWNERLNAMVQNWATGPLLVNTTFSCLLISYKASSYVEVWWSLWIWIVEYPNLFFPFKFKKFQSISLIKNNLTVSITSNQIIVKKRNYFLLNWFDWFIWGLEQIWWPILKSLFQLINWWIT